MLGFNLSIDADATECRRLANACRKIAAAGPDAREEYLALAEYWDCLALQYERLAGFEVWYSANLTETRTRH